MYKIIRYVGALYLFFLTGCYKTAQKKQQILALKTMSTLATTEYTITKIVKASDNQNWYTVGNRKILLSCQANIKSGINLSQLSEEDITISNKSISIHLPEPELISLNIPPGNIKVEYQEVGFLRDEFTNAERDALMTQGEMQIRNSLDELGIYQKAKEHSQSFFIAFLKQLGFEDIKVFFRKNENPVLTNEKKQ